MLVKESRASTGPSSPKQPTTSAPSSGWRAGNGSPTDRSTSAAWRWLLKTHRTLARYVVIPRPNLESDLNDSVSMEIAAWLQGVGTVAAVVLALFMQVFIVWYRRPRIDLRVSPGPDGQDLVTSTPDDRGYNICRLRGRLSVIKGKPASDVEVIVQDWRSPTSQSPPLCPRKYPSVGQFRRGACADSLRNLAANRPNSLDGGKRRRSAADSVARFAKFAWLPAETLVSDHRERSLFVHW